VKLPAPEYMAALTTATLLDLLTPLLLVKWVKGVVRGIYFIAVEKPMQLINTRFARSVNSGDDMMSVVKTAVSCLSKLDKRLAKYYRLQKEIFTLNYKINQLKKSSKRIPSPRLPKNGYWDPFRSRKTGLL
jgi:hypothetical protein